MNTFVESRINALDPPPPSLVVRVPKFRDRVTAGLRSQRGLVPVCCPQPPSGPLGPKTVAQAPGPLEAGFQGVWSMEPVLVFFEGGIKAGGSLGTLFWCFVKDRP